MVPHVHVIKEHNGNKAPPNPLFVKLGSAGIALYETRREKPCFRDVRTGPTQARLSNHNSEL